MDTVKKTRVMVFVDQDAAILGGHSTYGSVIVPIDPAALSPEQRHYMVAGQRVFHEGEHLLSLGQRQVGHPIATAEVDQIPRLLDDAIAEKARISAELEQTTRRVVAALEKFTPEDWLDQARRPDERARYRLQPSL